jgi:hypothetical protein
MVILNLIHPNILCHLCTLHSAEGTNIYVGPLIYIGFDLHLNVFPFIVISLTY